MREKTDAFSHATDALSQLGIPKILEALRATGISVRRSDMGGSHSVVTYPPLHALRKTESPAVTYGKTTSLYIHIPFCESVCTFCHYVVQHYRGNRESAARQSVVSGYMHALNIEMNSWAHELGTTGTTITSIYIGGGTPLVLETHQLVDLLDMIRLKFKVAEGADICVEASPLTITATDGLAKLQTLRQHGVTRLSFGVQSLDNEVLLRAGRGYERATAIRACMIAAQVFDNWNIDLIQSLYKGTSDEIWENLQAIDQVRPPHVTWYHGRFMDRPQGHWRNEPNMQKGFENDQQTLFGRMLIWQELAQMGYRQIDGNRFVLGERFVDPFKKTRTSVTSDLLGLGVSAYSHVGSQSHEPGGLFFRNTTKTPDYVNRLETGFNPIESGFTFDPDEHLAASYVVGLRTGRLPFQAHVYASEVAVSYYDRLIHELSKVKVLELVNSDSGTMIRLSELGRLFEDEILALFYSPRVLELLAPAK
ncbi:MAG: oxygen-independent coproporphyrinogen III oxidase [Parcubacteria bacterium C7867-008]|nr:MAG: oxygen-independent coproporphyrinogen III oxidase [Parcubacteria bacterium C7867-008]